MAYSGSTDFEYTRDQLIKAALRKCRAYSPEGDDLQEYQITTAAEALNIIAKTLATSGTVLWLQTNLEIPLVKGKRSYTLGPSGDVVTVRPTRVFNPVRRKISDNTDTPMDRYSRSDYENLTNKFVKGTPVNIFYDRRVADGELYVWPVPDTSTQKIILTVEIPMQDFDSSGDTAYVPSYAYSYLVWQLAADLASEYGISLEESRGWEVKAMAAKAELLAFEDDTTEIQLMPDIGWC
jgi:hypothetical protein